MTLKLHHVVRDVTRVTGRALIPALLTGERNPSVRARVRARPCRQSEAESARALPGTWRPEQLVAFQPAVELYECYPRPSAACARQIDGQLQTLADQSGGKPLPAAPRNPNRRRNDPPFDVREPLFRAPGVDLRAMEGIEEHPALGLRSEIGTDLRRGPTEKQFAAWLGLCPRPKISRGKVLSRKVRPSANRAAVALGRAARCLHHSQSALGAFFRRLKARGGTPKAVGATTHKLARLVSRLLKHGEAYGAQGRAEDEQISRDRVLKPLARQAKELGYQLLPTNTQTPQETAVKNHSK